MNVLKFIIFKNVVPKLPDLVSLEDVCNVGIILCKTSVWRNFIIFSNWYSHMQIFKIAIFFLQYTPYTQLPFFFHEKKAIFDSNKPFILKYFFQFFFHRTVLLFLRPRSALSSWFHQNTKCIMYNDKPHFLNFQCFCSEQHIATIIFSYFFLIWSKYLSRTCLSLSYLLCGILFFSFSL